MTSKPGAQECFVHIVLPGTSEFVTAGRLVLEQGRNGVPVGQFVYGKSYLARENAVPIDPLELKLGTATYQTTALKGVFGAIWRWYAAIWGATPTPTICSRNANGFICRQRRSSPGWKSKSAPAGTRSRGAAA